MPKISVLMNCFNGQKYLEETIQSVFNQTFNDWEIIFIDNCSTDNSANIAKSYGNKIQYFKTDKNIPLGAARNFGLEKCKGEFIAFLDTDDIWFPTILEELLNTIESGEYGLVYAGQIEINSNGEVIGETIPVYKKGNIFKELLLQFDIPIVTTMIKKSILLENNLNFDMNVSASEEYCLFMQLSVNNQYIVVPKALVKYRIHSDALTNKSISKWATERRYTLNKILKENDGILIKFKREFKEAFARAAYYEAQYLMSINKKLEAFKALYKYMFVNYRYFILAALTILPSFCWKTIQNKKYKRN
jgi:glycosyltransferase involved in cell wall biosynthesis